jgi:hypothetical protein
MSVKKLNTKIASKRRNSVRCAAAKLRQNTESIVFLLRPKQKMDKMEKRKKGVFKGVQPILYV